MEGSQRSVVMAINRLGVGGAQRLVIEDIKEFLKRGWRVELLTFAPEAPDTLEYLVPEECVRTMIPFTSHHDLRAWIACMRFLKNRNPDLIVTHLWFSNVIIKISGTLCGYRNRILAFEQNLSGITKTRKQAAFDRLLQFLCLRVVAVSTEIRDSVLADGILPSRIALILMAHDTERLAQVVASPIREECGLGDEFLFLSAGRLTQQKAIDVLLKSFADVPTGKLLIAGDGEDRKDLEQQAHERGLSDRVIFLGVRNDVPGLMKATDCFVFPSRWEGFGMVLLEAMAVGAPIIVTDYPSVFDIVRDEQSALIVKREDVEGLASAMNRIQTDSDLRSRLASGAVEDVKQFSPVRHVDQILEVSGLQ